MNPKHLTYVFIPGAFPWPLVLLISCLVVTGVNIFGLVRGLRHKDQPTILRRSRLSSFIASMILLLEIPCVSIWKIDEGLQSLLRFDDAESLAASLPMWLPHWYVLLGGGTIASALGFLICQILASLERPKE